MVRNLDFPVLLGATALVFLFLALGRIGRARGGAAHGGVYTAYMVTRVRQYLMAGAFAC